MRGSQCARGLEVRWGERFGVCAHQSKRCGLRVIRVMATLRPWKGEVVPVGRAADNFDVFTGDASRGGASLPGDLGTGEAAPERTPPVGSDVARRTGGGGVTRPDLAAIALIAVVLAPEWLE